jgi:GT2 family glycosyltransferase
LLSVDLSVVIPVRNGAADLAAQLESLVQQEFHGTWEVLVADNGSTDDIAGVTQAFVGRIPGLRTVDASSKSGQAFALNAGAAEASGASLIFLDADDLVTPGYLTAMAAALTANPFVAARLDCETLNASWLVRSRPPTQTDGIGAPFGFLPSAAGCSIGVWKSVFESVGGFDPSIILGNDVDFCWRIQQRSHHLVFVPDAVVQYRYRDRMGSIFRQARSYGTAGPVLYRRYRSLGMPRRSWRTAVRFHAAAIARLVRIRSKADAASVVFLLGFRVGILEGCIRSRVLYL